MTTKKRGIHELYENDPEQADELLWGRKPDPISRRGFLTKGSVVAMSAAVGASIPFAHLMPGGLMTGQHQFEIVYGIGPIHRGVVQDGSGMPTDHGLIDVLDGIELNRFHVFEVIQFQTHGNHLSWMT